MERRVALVTGAARRLGAEIARHLGSSGYTTLVHYHTSGDAAQEVAATIRAAHGEAWTVAADVTVAEQVAAMFRAIGGRYGRLDVLVNNVGTYHVQDVLEVVPDQWRYVVEGNLTATYLCCHFALPLLRAAGAGGRVVNLGYASCDRILARPRATAYQLAKTGVLIYSKSLARALAPEGITVNVISPGHLENSVDLPADIAVAVPAGRAGRAADILGALDYLLSPAAAYVTGQNLDVAGGFNL
ncbi:MAG TPA: SDR family NAD(P)-dependent oxidoreductase [bacterium]